MSYEGYVEFISEKGYYAQADCWDSGSVKEINGDPIAYRHSVDQTNGYGAERNWAQENNLPHIESYTDENAPKEEIGWDDLWLKDHHGNPYTVKQFKFQPVLQWWQKV